MTAFYCAADSFKRAGAYKSCGFSYQIYAVFSCHKVPEAARPRGETRFCSDGRRQVKTRNHHKPFLLLLKGPAAVLRCKASSIYEAAVFMYYPGTAFAGLLVEYAGVERGSGIFVLEPLLYGHIFHYFFIREKCSAHYGAAAVSSDYTASLKRFRSLRCQYMKKEPFFAAVYFQAASFDNGDAFRHMAEHKPVKGESVHIEVVALIKSYLPCFQVHSLYRKYLRIGQNTFWKSEIKSCKYFLSVRRQKAAAWFGTVFCLTVDDHNF